MKVFDFDPRDYARAYKDEGYVHIREGVSREFHAALVEYAERELTSHKLDDFAIKGKKEQSLYDFPDEVDIGELYDVVCHVRARPRERDPVRASHPDLRGECRARAAGPQGPLPVPGVDGFLGQHPGRVAARPVPVLASRGEPVQHERRPAPSPPAA